MPLPRPTPDDPHLFFSLSLHQPSEDDDFAMEVKSLGARHPGEPAISLRSLQQQRQRQRQQLLILVLQLLLLFSGCCSFCELVAAAACPPRVVQLAFVCRPTPATYCYEQAKAHTMIVEEANRLRSARADVSSFNLTFATSLWFPTSPGAGVSGIVHQVLDNSVSAAASPFGGSAASPISAIIGPTTSDDAAALSGALFSHSFITTDAPPPFFSITATLSELSNRATNPSHFRCV